MLIHIIIEQEEYQALVFLAHSGVDALPTPPCRKQSRLQRRGTTRRCRPC
jgi:hypothetical protein